MKIGVKLNLQEYPVQQMKSVKVVDRDKLIIGNKHTFTRSKFSDVTENRPLICTRLALDLSSEESLNPNNSCGNKN